MERFHICTRDREKNEKNVVRRKIVYFPRRDFDVTKMRTYSYIYLALTLFMIMEDATT